jgi:VWFA-related protein
MMPAWRIINFMRRLRFAGSVAIVVALGLAFAQEAEEVLRVDVDLVNLLFSVRDKKGALVGNLEKEDFTVFEEGKQQTIKHFTRETDLPLTLGLLVDVSRSQENLIEVEKHAAQQFFTKVLRPKDMAFLIGFGSEAELLQDSTNSVKLLRAGLDQLRLSVPTPDVFHPGPVPTSKKRGTILYDAIYLAANEKLKGEVGRKAIVVITDGVDMGSRLSLSEAIASAHRADTIIYSIYYTDPRYAYFGGGDSELKKMSEETGGRMFRVDRKKTLDDIFNQIQEEMRSQYSIVYTPSNTARDGSFRKLEVKTARKDLKVQVRKGYYATPSTSN